VQSISSYGISATLTLISSSQTVSSIQNFQVKFYMEDEEEEEEGGEEAAGE
jgi:hypothetical protein